LIFLKNLFEEKTVILVDLKEKIQVKAEKLNDKIKKYNIIDK
jgi:hypothetical protein